MHFCIDGFHGYRSRFDDVRLIQEVLAELPDKSGCRPIMPPFLLPYFDGVVPEDCGISAFVLLLGGHFTIHTFSFRECYFADLYYCNDFKLKIFSEELKSILPCKKTYEFNISEEFTKNTYSSGCHFGPHLNAILEDIESPNITFEKCFELLDKLPSILGMTPIMRPYVLKTKTGNSTYIISGITMIAESHISIHYYSSNKTLYFDLFSCRPFDVEKIISKLKTSLPGVVKEINVIGRGKGYQRAKMTSEMRRMNQNMWVSQC